MTLNWQQCRIRFLLHVRNVFWTTIYLRHRALSWIFKRIMIYTSFGKKVRFYYLCLLKFRYLSSWWLLSFSASMRVPNIRLFRESSKALDTSVGSLKVMMATRTELGRVLMRTARREQPPRLYSRCSSSFSFPSEPIDRY